MLASGSIKLFRIAGTDVRVHPTFFLLLAWIAALHWLNEGVGSGNLRCRVHYRTVRLRGPA